MVFGAPMINKYFLDESETDQLSYERACELSTIFGVQPIHGTKSMTCIIFCSNARNHWNYIKCISIKWLLRHKRWRWDNIQERGR